MIGVEKSRIVTWYDMSFDMMDFDYVNCIPLILSVAGDVLFLLP